MDSLMSLITGFLTELLSFDPFLWLCASFVFAIVFAIIRSLLHAFDREG